MTYNADEASVYKGKPIELYGFVGTFQSYFYTSHNEDVIYGGQLYTARPMKRSRIKVTTPSSGSSDLTVDLPATDPIILAYAFGIAPPDLYMTLTRYHDPADVVVYWQGNVTNMRVAGETGSITCPNEISRAVAGEVPSVLYQSQCNNVLGDEHCGQDLPALSHDTYMVSYFNSDITVQSDNGKPDGFYVNGFLVTPHEKRAIIGHVGNVLTLAFPLTKKAYKMPVTLRPGCNLAYTGDCLTKFNNQPNFGGHPFIPNVNPFAAGID